MPARPFPRALAGALAVSLLALGACSDLQGTEGKEYVGGGGQVVVIDPADRGAPVEASGTSVDGDPLAVADYRGKVVVANVWGAWCVECRKEMPLVVKLDQDLDPQDAVVLGIDIRESSAETGRAFQRNFSMDFPSFYDPGSTVLLGFSERINPRTIPSTAVLDRRGRLAALVLGPIPGEQTMTDLVEEVAAEDG